MSSPFSWLGEGGMTHYWRQITVMIVGALFMILIAWFFIGNAKKDTEAFNITEALRTAAISNKDDSARIQPGTFYLDQANFEKEFEQTIKKQPFYAKKTVKVTFNYLKEADNKGIKGIRAYVESDGSIDEATCILSTPEGG
jgi:energy-coupling factor transporter transmembrane protein EcfT